MTKILLNNKELEVISFNRNTSTTENGIFGNAFISLVPGGMNATIIHQLIKEPNITSLVLIKDDEVIYNAGEINATITSINETLTEDGMNLIVNIDFH